MLCWPVGWHGYEKGIRAISLFQEAQAAPSWNALKRKAASPMDHPSMVKPCHIRHRWWLAGATSCKVPGTHIKSPAARDSPAHPSSPCYRQLVNLICDAMTSCTRWVGSQQGAALQMFVSPGHWGEGGWGGERAGKAKQPACIFPVLHSACETWQLLAAWLYRGWVWQYWYFRKAQKSHASPFALTMGLVFWELLWVLMKLDAQSRLGGFENL